MATIDQTRSVIDGRCFVLTFRLDRIDSSEDSAIFIFGAFAWNCLLTPTFSCFGSIMSPYDITCHPNSEKGPLCAETRSFSSNNVWRLVQRDREKTTGQSKTSQMCYISHRCGEASAEPIWTKFCVIIAVFDIIMCAQSQNQMFRGLRFYRGSNFPVFLLIFAQAFHAAVHR